MKASLVKFSGEKIVIKREDGRSFTVSPDIFSEEDRKYVVEVQKRIGPSGKPWDQSSAIQALVSGKWLDHSEDQVPTRRNYWDFRRNKIDIDNNGKTDGNEVRVRANFPGARSRVFAWEVNEEGGLTVKYPFAKAYREVYFEYDFDEARFILKKGGALAQYLKPAKRQIEK